MNIQTPEQFESSIAASLAQKRQTLAAVELRTVELEKTIIRWSTDPSEASLLPAIQAMSDHTSLKALLELAESTCDPKEDFARFANSPEGVEVLKAYLGDKQAIVGALRAKIKPLRQAAADIESANEQEFFRLNAEASDLADLAASYDIALAQAGEGIARFAADRADSNTTYATIRDILSPITA
ncbi:MAG: hypothetical protein WCS65_02415 [Verrucomicrobiae bacterium]